MIVLDLEWNQPFGGRRMEEIIQIGAVRLARPGGPVVDTFNAHIQPTIYRKLSPVAKKLPESAQALTSQLDFATAYQAFLDWCGGDTLWAEWGAQDHGVLASNAAYWKLSAPPVTACIDLQAAFGRTLGIDLGRRVVPSLTDQERAAFSAAREHEPFRCTREKAGRKRRRKSAKTAKE